MFFWLNQNIPETRAKGANFLKNLTHFFQDFPCGDARLAIPVARVIPVV